MNDPEIINPYEIEEGELPPPPADSDTSFNSELEVEAEDEDENEAATIGTITRAPYRRRSENREHYELKESVSMLEDEMRGLMFKDKEEKERLKKKLKGHSFRLQFPSPLFPLLPFHPLLLFGISNRSGANPSKAGMVWVGLVRHREGLQHDLEEDLP
nr:hypothetical protein [Tanacetum cinerariifolium]